METVSLLMLKEEIYRQKLWNIFQKLQKTVMRNLETCLSILMETLLDHKAQTDMLLEQDTEG